MHVGDRVPVISSTIVGTTSVGQGGAAPVTTEQIQYIDVGIKIEAEPTIHPDDTVAVKINLDVSSLGTQTKTNAGTTAYEVGTRNATTVLRLRDGETQALMGLIRDDDIQAGAGLPFIGEAPVLDRIFGIEEDRSAQPRADPADHAATGTRHQATRCDDGGVLVRHRRCRCACARPSSSKSPTAEPSGRRKRAATDAGSRSARCAVPAARRRRRCRWRGKRRRSLKARAGVRRRAAGAQRRFAEGRVGATALRHRRNRSAGRRRWRILQAGRRPPPCSRRASTPVSASSSPRMGARRTPPRQRVTAR